MKLQKRSSGILLHITSLPGRYGVGDIGTSSFNFIDFLVKSGQSHWQILPLSPVSSIFGNSPYMSFSAFAGNPLIISPDLLHEDGLISDTDLHPVGSEYLVDFEAVNIFKKDILRKAFNNYCKTNSLHDFDTFFNKPSNAAWLDDYALFMALKEKFHLAPWYDWPPEIRSRDRQTILSLSTDLTDRIAYYKFEQFLFFNQWQKLKQYASDNSITLIGDIPIYVGLDSSDVWTNQNIFDLSPDTGLPEAVAGVPPDYFSKTGQRWGNPLYNWSFPAAQTDLYTWWQKRLESTLSMVDMIRIDHFRGFESYWAIPAKEKTAVNGKWCPGPGKEFFQAMQKALGPLPILAEDLGIITPEVVQLRDALSFPGMKVLLFAFDGNPDNTHLPHNHLPNSIVYSGTHDNDTAVGWYLSEEVSSEAKRQVKKYANRKLGDQSPIHVDIMYLALSSSAFLAILPMQDVLGFGNDCRMNTPGTEKGNWEWRCSERFLTDDTANNLRKKTIFFGRMNRKTE